MTGYLNQNYAQSLEEFGLPIKLFKCQGWILKRKLAGFPYYDAMGCYPLFACKNWSRLHFDLEDLKGDLISLSIVADPFGDYDENYLRRCFKDVVIPFKKHYIIDLSCRLNSFACDHHRRYARKALQKVTIEKCDTPTEFTEDWNRLYANLIARHNIKGIAAFSVKSFKWQTRVPGLVVFRAIFEDRTIGMLLWYVLDKVAYYHLGAYSDLGYAMRASFALFWSAIEYFADLNVKWINLGAGAGLAGNGVDGLSRFKHGWATGTRPAYFCGRIFDQERYARIMEKRECSGADYFPAYRQGEFGQG